MRARELWKLEEERRTVLAERMAEDEQRLQGRLAAARERSGGALSDKDMQLLRLGVPADGEQL